MFDYKGRVVLVTGASSGLGKQMAEAFAKQGADVVIVARRLDRLQELAETIKGYGVKCLPLKCDVTNTEEINSVVAEAIKEFGKIDVLVNNDGSNKAGSVTDLSDEDWNFTMEIDLTSVFKVTRAVSKHMVEKGYGRIINIASMYGILATNQNASAYHATKAGVIHFTRAASAELSPKGITCNAICPGYFGTELTDAVINTDEFKGYMQLTVPMQRAGKTGELNAGALFLGSEEASYVTGVALPIDGGWSSTK